MTDLLNIIAFSVATVIIFVLLGYVIVLKFKNKKLAEDLIQAIIDKMAISNQFAQVLNNKKVKDLEESDGFLKFLSESREAAFKYIEDFQEAMGSFIQEVGPVIETYKKVDSPSAGTKRLIKAYEDLIQIMPKNNIDNN